MNQHALLATLAALVLLPAQAADMNKVLRVALNAPETGFDPAKVSDLYSSTVTENIFDPLVTYDYLARPAKLIPNTVSALPTISADGKVYTFRLKPGIHFAADPAFRSMQAAALARVLTSQRVDQAQGMDGAQRQVGQVAEEVGHAGADRARRHGPRRCASDGRPALWVRGGSARHRGLDACHRAVGLSGKCRPGQGKRRVPAV